MKTESSGDSYSDDAVEVSVGIRCAEDRSGRKFLLLDKNDCEEWQRLIEAVKEWIEEERRHIGRCH